MKNIQESMVCFFMLMVCSYTASMHAQSNDRPNILLISVDDLGDFTGYFGEHPQTFTPAIDRLAATGTAFVSAFCNAPVCAASRTSFLTGKRPEYTDVFSNENFKDNIGAQKRFRGLFERATGDLPVYTMAEWLKDSGDYYTIGMGKLYHGFARSGYDRDFDEVEVDPCARGLSWSAFVDVDPTDDPEPTSGAPGSFHDGVTGTAAGAIDDSQESDMMDYKQTDSAIAFLQAYGADRTDFCDRPFFMAVGYYRPHAPFFAPRKYFSEHWQPDLYQVPFDRPYNDPPGSWPPNGIDLAVQPPVPYADYFGLDTFGRAVSSGYNTHRKMDEYGTTISPLPHLHDSLTDAERLQIIADARRANVTMSYLASVRFVDAQIERLLTVLESDPEMAANTIVVLFSDHGFNLGQKRHWQKSALWDQILRIPLVIRDPGRPGGVLQEAPASLIDVFPTLCAMTGVPEPTMPDGSPYFDGRSLEPLLDAIPTTTARPSVASFRFPSKVWTGCHTQHSVHTGRFHMIRYQMESTIGAVCGTTPLTHSTELYDLGVGRSGDRHEWNNLAADPNYADLIAWLEAWLPGGALAGTDQPGMAIRPLDIPCPPTMSDRIRLTSQSPTPAGYTLHWTIPSEGIALGADTLAFDLNLLDTTYWSSDRELVIQAALKDSLGRTVALDLFRLPIARQTKGAGFASLPMSTGAGFRFVPDDSVRAIWNFGNGVSREVTVPAPFHYTAPGAYVVTRTVEGANGCQLTASDTVVVNPGAFAGVCPQPFPPATIERAPDGLRLDVPPVANTGLFDWRMREAAHSQSAWTGGLQTTSTTQVLSGLEPAMRYEIQVRSACGTDTSEWSISTFAETTPCRPPHDLTTVRIGDSLRIQWSNRAEAASAGVAVLDSFEIVLARRISKPGTSWTIPPPSAPTFQVGAVHFCRKLGGSPTYRSQDYVLVTVEDTTAVVDVSERTAGHEDAAIRTWPNPASDGFFHVMTTTEDPAQLGTTANFVLTGADGRVRDRWQEDVGSSTRRSTSHLAPGIYLLQWLEAGIVDRVVVP